MHQKVNVAVIGLLVLLFSNFARAAEYLPGLSTLEWLYDKEPEDSSGYYESCYRAICSNGTQEIRCSRRLAEYGVCGVRVDINPLQGARLLPDGTYQIKCQIESGLAIIGGYWENRSLEEIVQNDICTDNLGDPGCVYIGDHLASGDPDGCAARYGNRSRDASSASGGSGGGSFGSSGSIVGYDGGGHPVVSDGFGGFTAFGAEGSGVNVNSPLVLNFTDHPITFMAKKVYFDYFGDGRHPLTGWIGPEFGFLVRDLNGNHVVDNAGELFGTETKVGSSSKATDGFNALKYLDSDFNGVIDAMDADFSKLLVWFDRNSNGISESDELVNLGALGIISLNLGYRAGKPTQVGNGFTGLVGTFSYKKNGRQFTGELSDVFLPFSNN